MITEKDLQEAIAECKGERNPNANTCIKLAAFYTIKEHMFDKPTTQNAVYSYAPSPVNSSYRSDTEFFSLAESMDKDELMELMDEVMTTLAVVNPRLYSSIIRKLS